MRVRPAWKVENHDLCGGSDTGAQFARSLTSLRNPQHEALPITQNNVHGIMLWCENHNVAYLAFGPLEFMERLTCREVPDSDVPTPTRNEIFSIVRKGKTVDFGLMSLDLESRFSVFEVCDNNA